MRVRAKVAGPAKTDKEDLRNGSFGLGPPKARAAAAADEFCFSHAALQVRRPDCQQPPSVLEESAEVESQHQPKKYTDWELATRLELVTCCLQDSCATDCATPACGYLP